VKLQVVVTCVAICFCVVVFSVRGLPPTRPVCWAVIYMDMGCLYRVLNWGGDVDAQHPGGTGERGLTMAASRGELRLVTLLLARGANVNAEDRLGFTALHRAAYADHVHVAEVLMRHGADVGAIAHDNGYTPLHCAASFGCSAMVAFLLDHGASIDARDAMGRTPVHVAMLHWEKDAMWQVVSLLIRRGADTSIQDDEGRTPLATAVERGHAAIADLLRNRGESEQCPGE